MILVTGATGFIGSEILRRASRRGWRVRGLARHPERAGDLARLPHVELFRGDVADPADLPEAMEDVTAIIHLVGIIAETGQQRFRRIHVLGARTVVEAAAAAGVPRIVHMSALGADRGRNATKYFRSKWEGEAEVEGGGLSYTIFRPSIVVGPGDEITGRIATAVRWSPVVPLPRGGRDRLQPVWVGDVAECFLQAARVPATPRKVYEVAGPEVVTLAALVRAVAAAAGRRRPVIVPVPGLLARAGAALAEALPGRPPVTRDQLKMLEVGNVSDPESTAALVRDFEIEHARLADVLPQWLGTRTTEETP